MRLEFEHGLIRDWSRGDRQELVGIADNCNVSRNMGDRFPHPYTRRDADRWFRYVSRMKPPTHWALEVDGCIVGAIGMEILPGMYRCSATLGYWLGEPWWGRGIATAAVRAAIPSLLRDFELARLEARVFTWNPASARVLEKCGFVREGTLRCSALKDGRLVDQHLYGYVSTKEVS